MQVQEVSYLYVSRKIINDQSNTVSNNSSITDTSYKIESQNHPNTNIITIRTEEEKSRVHPMHFFHSSRFLSFTLQVSCITRVLLLRATKHKLRNLHHIIHIKLDFSKVMWSMFVLGTSGSPLTHILVIAERDDQSFFSLE